MRITDLLKKEAIRLNASAKDKMDAIDQLVDLHVRAGNVIDREAYKAAILKREEEGTTGMGDGIAIPHARTEAVREAGLAFMSLPEGVDFASLDGSPATTIFMIAAPADSSNFYMEVLSRLATLLMEPDFTKKLREAKDPEDVLFAIDEAEGFKLEAEARREEERKQTSDLPEVLAVTACPTGIAHTYMAAENLEKKAREMGVRLKAETQGSVGAKNVLTNEEIQAAKGIIIAADKNIELARFAGKPVYVTSVSRGINEPEALINKILNNEAPVYESSRKVETGTEEKDSLWHTFYKNLMNGVSHMLPFVVGGGILIALSFLVDNQALNPSGYGSNTPLAAFFNTVGSSAFGFMLPILAGYIAMSIADRPGLAVGFVGGALASSGYSFSWIFDRSLPVVSAGFLGALLAGFVGGYVTLALEKLCEKLPDSLEGLKPVLIYPLVGILLIGTFMFLVNPLMASINTGITNLLSSMGTANLVLLGAVVGGMMSVDMGGPVNKAAYVFGTAMLGGGTDAGKIIMAAVMVGGMVPPMAVALSTTLFKNKWTEEERKAGIVNYIMGLSFISEGAIPYAAADPIRVLPSCILGSALAGALSAAAGCMSPAPHGGLWVVAVISNPVMYIVALLAGSLLAAVLMALFKKKLS
ncbi:MAG: PTS sugar transporter subunit IIA [Erysipelotrichaceae bacterium]|nr:PTS sugar transporter subunit IIA [Erysipelotrichaceae bacterium]